jgi:hypothetical protein
MKRQLWGQSKYQSLMHDKDVFCIYINKGCWSLFSGGDRTVIWMTHLVQIGWSKTDLN